MPERYSCCSKSSRTRFLALSIYCDLAKSSWVDDKARTASRTSSRTVAFLIVTKRFMRCNPYASSCLTPSPSKSRCLPTSSRTKSSKTSASMSAASPSACSKRHGCLRIHAMAELRHFGSLPFVFMIGSIWGNQFAWRATDVGWV